MDFERLLFFHLSTTRVVSALNRRRCNIFSYRARQPLPIPIFFHIAIAFLNMLAKRLCSKWCSFHRPHASVRARNFHLPTHFFTMASMRFLSASIHSHALFALPIILCCQRSTTFPTVCVRLTSSHHFAHACPRFLFLHRRSATPASTRLSLSNSAHRFLSFSSIAW